MKRFRQILFSKFETKDNGENAIQQAFHTRLFCQSSKTKISLVNIIIYVHNLILEFFFSFVQ